jgi:hypothetical protein
MFIPTVVLHLALHRAYKVPADPTGHVKGHGLGASADASGGPRSAARGRAATGEPGRRESERAGLCPVGTEAQRHVTRRRRLGACDSRRGAGLEAERSCDEPTSDRSDHDHYAENPKRLAPGHVDLYLGARAWLRST